MLSYLYNYLQFMYLLKHQKNRNMIERKYYLMTIYWFDASYLRFHYTFTQKVKLFSYLSIDSEFWRIKKQLNGCSFNALTERIKIKINTERWSRLKSQAAAFSCKFKSIYSCINQAVTLDSKNWSARNLGTFNGGIYTQLL